MCMVPDIISLPFTNERLRMDLAGTAIPRESAFNILLQNCVERQAVYERVPTATRSPTCPLAPCCLQRPYGRCMSLSLRTIAVGGAVLAVILLHVSRSSKVAELVIDLAFLGFFGWLALRLWLRDKL
jgi:hypothetical protein